MAIQAKCESRAPEWRGGQVGDRYLSRTLLATSTAYAADNEPMFCQTPPCLPRWNTWSINSYLCLTKESKFRDFYRLEEDNMFELF